MSKKKKAMGVERRTATIYARVKPSNKAKLQKQAKQSAISESKLLDSVLSRWNPSAGGAIE